MVPALGMPFVIAIGIPAFTGDRLSDSEDFVDAIELAARHVYGLGNLGGEAAVQAFFFQQFLIFLMLVPVAGAMSLASFSVIGEKQARSLEPLLATPLTTAELLAAKVTASTLPAVAVELFAVILYMIGIGWLAEPGVLSVLLSVRTFLIVAVLAPLSSLVALQLAVLASSRVNDPRTAQQIGVLIILPIIGIVIAQFSGAFFLTLPLMGLLIVALAAVWIVMFLLSVKWFQRETILTRWQ
jgi:ABC-2 type transport system permease protein